MMYEVSCEMDAVAQENIKNFKDETLEMIRPPEDLRRKVHMNTVISLIYLAVVCLNNDPSPDSTFAVNLSQFINVCGPVLCLISITIVLFSIISHERRRLRMIKYMGLVIGSYRFLVDSAEEHRKFEIQEINDESIMDLKVVLTEDELAKYKDVSSVVVSVPANDITYASGGENKIFVKFGNGGIDVTICQKTDNQFCG